MILQPMLIAACAFAMPGGNLLQDGNFDALTPGTPPNCDAPAGAWGWPANYVTALVCETSPAEMAIIATSVFDPGATGNSLGVTYSKNAASVHLTNIMGEVIAEATDPLVTVQFDIFVLGGGGGGSIYVGGDHGGGGFSNATDRGPQLSFLANGSLVCTNTTGGNVVILPTYPTGEWQTVRIEIDMISNTFDCSWAAEGDPLALVASDLPFRAASGIDHIDRVSVVHFGGTTPTERSFVDNISVELPGPACAADINGDNVTDVNDLLLLVGSFGATGANAADLNGDLIVDVNDLLILVGDYNCGLP